MIKQKAKKLLRSERGDTMVSYALLAALVAAVCVPSARSISWGVGETVCRISAEGQYVEGLWDGSTCWTGPDRGIFGDPFWPTSSGGGNGPGGPPPWWQEGLNDHSQISVIGPD